MLQLITSLLFMLSTISLMAADSSEQPGQTSADYSTTSPLLVFSVHHDDWHTRPTPTDIEEIIDLIKNTAPQLKMASVTQIRMRYEPPSAMSVFHSGLAINIIYAGEQNYQEKRALKEHLLKNIKTTNGFYLIISRTYTLKDWPYYEKPGWVLVQL